MNRFYNRQYQSIQPNQLGANRNDCLNNQSLKPHVMSISNKQPFQSPSFLHGKIYYPQLKQPVTMQPVVVQKRLNDFIVKKKVVTQSSIEDSGIPELFPQINNSPIHMKQQSVFMTASMDPQKMLGIAQKEISLSSSSCLSESSNEEKFGCEKAFEIMQLIDQQINKNETPEMPIYKFSFSNNETPNDIKNATQNIQSFIKNLQKPQQQKSKTFLTSKDFSKLGSSYFGNSESSFQQRLVSKIQKQEESSSPVHSKQQKPQPIEIISFAQQNYQAFITSTKFETDQLHCSKENKDIHISSQFVSSKQLQELEEEKKNESTQKQQKASINNFQDMIVYEYQENLEDALFEPVIESHHCSNFNESSYFQPSTQEQQFQENVNNTKYTQSFSQSTNQILYLNVEKKSPSTENQKYTEQSNEQLQINQSREEKNHLGYNQNEMNQINEFSLPRESVQLISNRETESICTRESIVANGILKVQSPEVKKLKKQIRIVEDSSDPPNQNIGITQILDENLRAESTYHSNSYNFQTMQSTNEKIKKSIKIIDDEEDLRRKPQTEPSQKQKRKIIVVEDFVEESHERQRKQQHRQLGYFNYQFSFLSPSHKSHKSPSKLINSSSKKKKDIYLNSSQKKLFQNQQLRIEKLEERIQPEIEMKKADRQSEYVCSSFVNLMDLSMKKNLEEMMDSVQSGTNKLGSARNSHIIQEIQNEQKSKNKEIQLLVENVSQSNLTEIQLIAENGSQSDLRQIQLLENGSQSELKCEIKQSQLRQIQQLVEDGSSSNLLREIQLLENGSSSKFRQIKFLSDNDSSSKVVGEMGSESRMKSIGNIVMKKTKSQENLQKNQGQHSNRNYSNHLQLAQEAINHIQVIKESMENNQMQIFIQTQFVRIADKQVIKKQSKNSTDYITKNKQNLYQKENNKIDPYFEFKRQLNKNLHSRKNTNSDNSKQLEEKLFTQEATHLYNKTVEQVQQKIKKQTRR